MGNYFLNAASRPKWMMLMMVKMMMMMMITKYLNKIWHAHSFPHRVPLAKPSACQLFFHSHLGFNYIDYDDDNDLITVDHSTGD